MTDSTPKLISVTAGICLMLSAWLMISGLVPSSSGSGAYLAGRVVGFTVTPLLLGTLGLLYRPNRGGGFMAVALGVMAIISFGAVAG